LDLLIKDRVVVVTGGAKGIGEAIARAAGEEDAIPVVLDRDAAAGEAFCAGLRKSGKRCAYIPVDLTQAEECARAIAQTVEQFGRLDALVNNAGVNDRVGLENGSPELYLQSLHKSLFHYYNMAHYALPHLKQSKGCIVNVSSKTAVTGQGGTSGYTSAKGAILSLTREWALELLPYSIRVNAVVPGDVMTPLYRQWLNTFPDPEGKLQSIVSNIPLERRMAKLEELAAMAVFLLSPKAGHITGQHLFVDGGYVHLDRAVT
jgi:L-fucose dehydrogenase